MEKFKAGDIVYHKATEKKGVISEIRDGRVGIAWQDGKESFHNEAELYTEQEYKDSKPDEGPPIVENTDI